ncbi:DUF4442 domain-containing protein [Pseudonocardia sp. H11422]|uniref:DUF4442 domain-containing protein n=1 Tax=Pseudonocardia sp. H11422 TaxID=2835866 RepID=UPI001BDC9340|nr:DUF4442 domain-containing protein [Pseudonocardia sp. H11422]
MSDDVGWVPDAMKASVPWVRTVGIEFAEVGPTRVVASLPDREELRNHVGGPHAAMIFGLAETASGAVGLAAFGATMERATPLVVSSQIGYRKLARGPLTAEAVLTRPADEVLAELDAGRRPEFTVDVTVRDADGTETTTVSVVWTLKPNRAASGS